MLNLLHFLQSKRVREEFKTAKEFDDLRLRAKDAFKDFTKTTGGQDFIQFLYLMYCDKPCIEESEKATIANVANKELVEMLIKYSSIENGEVTNE